MDQSIQRRPQKPRVRLRANMAQGFQPYGYGVPVGNEFYWHWTLGSAIAYAIAQHLDKPRIFIGVITDAPEPQVLSE